MKEVALTNNQSQLKVIESGLKEAITQHALYAGEDGKKSSGSKGLALQIAIRVKKNFGESREEMGDREIGLLCLLFEEIIKTMKNMGSLGMSRSDIKKSIYALIESYGAKAND